MKTSKDRVKLRKRLLTTGFYSLYLDISDNGVRRYEYLKIYLYAKPATSAEREKNRELLMLAEAKRAERQIIVHNKEHGLMRSLPGNDNFISFFSEMLTERAASPGNWGSWDATLKQLKKYKGEDITFKQVDEDYAEGFKKFLTTAKSITGKKFSQNTQHLYFSKFIASLRNAEVKGLILKNPTKGIKSPKKIDSEKNYLDVSEIQKLFKQECKTPVLKEAFLFSCLTGLRWSDLQNLTWGQVRTHNGYTRISFIQQKTKSQEYLDINPQSLVFLGERMDDNEKIFPGLKFSGWANVKLQIWIYSAKIQKEITFHCARHTFAIMMLELGEELFTVSKLLGHKDLKTTQIYAKVLDKKKQDAMSKIPDLGFDLKD